ncbi:MAG: NusG domain II-containing protein [Oscillospiraceae bacterium]|nr:NusG domain II-containing protein [Oscillospiraceae bacterium]
MKRKTLFWIVLFALVALAAGGWYVLRPGGGVTAAVYVDGALYDRIDLSAAAIPYEVTVRTEYGFNTLRVSHGAIAVTEADCSEQICVHQGQIRDSLLPIVCLPHHLVIQIED